MNMLHSRFLLCLKGLILLRKNRMMVEERTLNNVIKATGITVHSGERAELTLRSAAPGTGIVFRRVDLAEPVEIPARVEYVGDTTLSTSLVKDVKGKLIKV